MRGLLWLVCAWALLTAVPTTWAAEEHYSVRNWDKPSLITPRTAFFGEKPREDKDAIGRPSREDKSYPWFYLQKGSEHVLEGDHEAAAACFREAYSVGGPTRVTSGFHLAQALKELERADEALDLLDEMENRYLVSPREIAEAAKWKQIFLDMKRKSKEPVRRPPMSGKEWLLNLQPWRLQFVLGAMDELRRHGVPLKESAQKYVFLLDEYFMAHPEAPAHDANAVLAALVYRRDPGARLAINRWQIHPEGTLTEEAASFDRKTNKMTGADWITLTHRDKMAYVEEAMQLLKGQQVPMDKTLYGYVDALDKWFTRQPELPSADPSVALASYLYRHEPNARKVLDALRLE